MYPKNNAKKHKERKKHIKKNKTKTYKKQKKNTSHGAFTIVCTPDL